VGAAGKGDVYPVAEPREGQREWRHERGKSDVGQRDSERCAKLSWQLRKPQRSRRWR